MLTREREQEAKSIWWPQRPRPFLLRSSTCASGA
uniref:Uncharacterized protein n=1 Tax=Arundo donax TaxID=35708 RepID=A0A0A9AK36_ARUDO